MTPRFSSHAACLALVAALGCGDDDVEGDGGGAGTAGASTTGGADDGSGGASSLGMTGEGDSTGSPGSTGSTSSSGATDSTDSTSGPDGAVTQCEAFLDCVAQSGVDELNGLEAQFGAEGRCAALGTESLLTCEATCATLHGRLMAMPDVASPDCTEPDSMGLRYPEPVAFWSERQPGVSCVPRCLADVDDATPAVELACDVVLNLATLDTRIVPPCGVADVPPEVGVCWTAVTDPAQMSAVCVDEGWNAEITLTFEGPAPAGATADANCQWSQQVAVDCPDLP